METLKILAGLFLIAACYLFTSDDDYHKEFDKRVIIRYNCNTIYDGTEHGVPINVLRKCKNPEQEYVYVETYKE